MEITVGDSPDGPIDVLVGGRPDPALLERCVRALVIPYAGLPRKTRALLLDRPDLDVFAVHHNAEAVAELAVALLLATARSLVPMDRALRAHDWRPRYAPDPSVELRGGTAVLIGMGAIGSRVAPVVRSLGMQVIPVRSTTSPGSLDAALAQARAVICAAPSTPRTAGLLDARRLGLLPENTVLVNVGRADLVDESALYETLAAGRIRAGLDVWYRYPSSPEVPVPPSNFPFETLDNVVLSPHRAGHGDHVERARTAAVEGVLLALAEGEEPPGRVDVVAGY